MAESWEVYSWSIHVILVKYSWSIHMESQWNIPEVLMESQCNIHGIYETLVEFLTFEIIKKPQ